MSAIPSRFTVVPVVDVSALAATGPESADRRRAAEELGRAAREVGFMYVTGHSIPAERFDRLLGAAQEFFALPDERKMRSWIGRSSNHRGYVPPGEEVFAGGGPDHKEAFDLAGDLPADDPDHLAGNPLLGPNQWPADLPGFREAVGSWYEAVFALGRTLFGGFALALGLPADAFEPLLTKPPSQLRLIHYPLDTSAEDRPGIGAHTDYECFTLLRPTAPGLEVLNGAGEWIDVPPRGDAFVVNIGDLLELWTGGGFVATTHRVRKVSAERYAFPLFFCVDYPTRVAPLPGFPALPGVSELIAGEHLFAQTAQTFRYLRQRVDEGAAELPTGALALSSFGRQARAEQQIDPSRP